LNIDNIVAECRIHAITTSIVAAAIANEIAITDPRNTAMQQWY